jgi:hypothetical protein
MPNRITQGEAIVGGLQTEQDVNVGDDLYVTGDTQIGSAGTAFADITVGTFTVNPGSISADATLAFDVTLTGATASDVVVLQHPALNDDILYVGHTTGTDLVTIFLYNRSAGSIDPASATWTYLWFDVA